MRVRISYHQHGGDDERIHFHADNPEYDRITPIYPSEVSNRGEVLDHIFECLGMSRPKGQVERDDNITRGAFTLTFD